MFPGDSDPWTILQNAASVCTEVVQRMAIVVVDGLLGLFALIALLRDLWSFCDEPLHIYTCVCGWMSGMDMLFEFVKFTMETSLDRLQDARPDILAPATDEGLLSSDSIGEGPVGVAISEGAARELRSSNSSVGLSRVVVSGAGVQREKATKRKGLANLHLFSLVFTGMVAIVFCFFAANDEECAEKAPNLYAYIHAFTYVVIFRLSAIILWICCRDMKNYEDAALTAISEHQAGTAMRHMA